MMSDKNLENEVLTKVLFFFENIKKNLKNIRTTECKEIIKRIEHPDNILDQLRAVLGITVKHWSSQLSQLDFMLFVLIHSHNKIKLIHEYEHAQEEYEELLKLLKIDHQENPDSSQIDEQ